MQQAVTMKRLSVLTATALIAAAGYVACRDATGVRETPMPGPITGPRLTLGASETGIDPRTVTGNISGSGSEVCADPRVNLTSDPTWLGVKLDPPVGGTYAGFVVTISGDGTLLAWTSTGNLMRAVVVKGGPDTYVYPYNPLARTSDAGLHAPTVSNENIPQISHYELCYQEAAKKSGTVSEDLDGDGNVGEAGEPALAARTIYVDYNDNTSLDPNEPSAVTGTDGTYLIVGILPGTWKVRLVPVADWMCSYPSGCLYDELFVAGTENTGNDFGLYRNATKTGMKFEDMDADGAAREAGDPVVAGWPIYLSGTSGMGTPVTMSTTTDALGAYSFSVPPGTYTVCEGSQTGWTQSYPATGASCAGIPSAIGVGYEVTLTSGQAEYHNDFGNWRPGEVNGVKFSDLNANRARDLGEPALSGFVFHLIGTTGFGTPVHLQQTTNASGAYSFSVPPGTYVLCEQRQSGWIQSFPTSGADCTALSITAGVTLEPLGYGETLQSGEDDETYVWGNTGEVYGCTPGYWKNHQDRWVPTGYTTSATLVSVFGVNAPAGTLLDALYFPGGPGVAGGKQILLRAAVASLLNMAHPDVAFTVPAYGGLPAITSTAGLISSVSTALGGSRGTMLALASQLDAANNAVNSCPLTGTRAFRQ
jgi:hypothetical protein